MLIRRPFDVSPALDGVEPVQGRFVGRDLTTGLDLTDEGRRVMLQVVALDKFEDRLLFLREGMCRQSRLRGVKTYNKPR